MQALGGDLTEDESERLFEHSNDPVTNLITFDRFAHNFMPQVCAHVILYDKLYLQLGVCLQMQHLTNCADLSGANVGLC